MGLKEYLQVTLPGKQNMHRRKALEIAARDVLEVMQTGELPTMARLRKINEPLYRRIHNLPGGLKEVLALVPIAIEEELLKADVEGNGGARER